MDTHTPTHALVSVLTLYVRYKLCSSHSYLRVYLIPNLELTTIQCVCGDLCCEVLYKTYM